MKEMAEQRKENMKVIQEKMNFSKKEMARFNPVSTILFPNVYSASICRYFENIYKTLDVHF